MDRYDLLQNMVDAVNEGNIDVLTKYLNEGANPNIRATDGYGSIAYGILSLAWEFARSNECIKLLVGRGLDTTDDCALYYVWKAINVNNFDIADFLLDRGVDVDQRLRSGYRMLTRAISERFAWGRIVEYLLDRGASIEGSEWRDERTPLMTAAELPDKEHILKILLDKGAKINAQDSKGQTALVRAIEAKELSSVRYLLKRGADWTITDVGGFNALYYAKQRRSSTYAELIQTSTHISTTA